MEAMQEWIRLHSGGGGGGGGGEGVPCMSCNLQACLCRLSTLNHPLVMCVDSVWRLCRSGSDSTMVVVVGGWGGGVPAYLV